MSEIQYKRGKFITFRATTKFHLGEKQRDIWEGDEIDFDGQTVKHQGEEFGAPSIRGAVKAGWLVPSSDNVSRYIPKAGGVVVHKAQSTGRERGDPIKIGHTQDEEQEVGLIKSHQDRVAAAREKDAAPRARPVAVPEPEPEPVQETPDPEELIDGLTAEELAMLSEDELVALGMQDEDETPPAPARIGPLDVGAADEANRAILAAALAVDVPKPKDPGLAYGGRRHDSTSDDTPDPKTAGQKKFTYKAAADDQGGQVVRKIQTSAPGVSVGAEGVRLPAQAMDVSKVSAMTVEASVKPIGGDRRLKLPDLGMTPPTDLAQARAAKIAAARKILAEKAKEKAEAAKKKPSKKAVVKKAAKKSPPGGPGGVATTGAVTMPDKLPEEADFEHKVPKGTATQITKGESLADKSSGATGDVKVTMAGDELADLLPDALVAGSKPAFSWNLNLHWKQRVSLAVKTYGDQPEVIKQILSVETPTVAKHIQSRIRQTGLPV